MSERLLGKLRFMDMNIHSIMSKLTYRRVNKAIHSERHPISSFEFNFVFRYEFCEDSAILHIHIHCGNFIVIIVSVAILSIPPSSPSIPSNIISQCAVCQYAPIYVSTTPLSSTLP